MAVRHIEEAPRQPRHHPAPPITARSHGRGPGQRSCRASRIGRHIAGRPVGHSSLRSWALDEFGAACSATGSVCVLDTRTCSRRHGRKQALNTSRGAPPHLAYALKLNSKTGTLNQATPKRLAGKDNWPMSSKTGQADPIAPPERTTLPNSQPILGRAVWIPGFATLEPSNRCLPQHVRAVRPGTAELWPSWLDR